MKHVLFLSLMMTLTSCGALMKSNGVTKITSENYAPTDANSIEIFISTEPSKDYLEIGTVSVLRVKSLVFPVPRPADKVMAEMKEQAASIGGDAIINYQESGEANMTGTIIKYK